MSETAREFTQTVANKMKEILESGAEAIPLCFVRKTNGQTLLVAFEFPADDGGRCKDLAAIAMRLMNQLPDTDYVVFLSDAWMGTAQGNIDDLMEMYEQYGSVRNMPGRKESIICSVFGKNRLTELAYWVYERVNGKLVFQTPTLEWVVPEHADGRFFPESAATRSRQ